MPIIKSQINPFEMTITSGAVLFFLWLQENSEYEEKFRKCLQDVRNSMEFGLLAERLKIAFEKCEAEMATHNINFEWIDQKMDLDTILDEYKTSFVN